MISPNALEWLLLIAVGTVAFAFCIAYLVVLDTPLWRWRVSRELQAYRDRLLSAASSDPRRHGDIQRILSAAQSDKRFRSCYGIWVLGSVAGVLGEHRVEAVRVLGKRLTTKDPFVRHAAATALLSFGRDVMSAAQDLYATATTHPEEVAGRLSSNILSSLDQEALAKELRASEITQATLAGVAALQVAGSAQLFTHASDDAMERLERLMRQQPENGVGALVLARLYTRRDKQYTNAVRLLARTIRARRAAEHRAGRSSDYGKDTASLYYNLACYYALSGKTKSAATNLKRTLALDRSLIVEATTDPDLKSIAFATKKFAMRQ